MSADNFYVINKHEGKYYVHMEFASNCEEEGVREIDIAHDLCFNTLAEVEGFLHEEDNDTEYPPVFAFPHKLIDISEDE